MSGARERARLTALALGFPSLLRTNAYWRRTKPEMVARAEEYSLARLWGKDERAAPSAPSAFDLAMAPYLGDPFRGAVERRIRAPKETALSMELTAARGALSAAGLTPNDLDLVLVSSFVGDRFGVGNAPYLARELGLSVPAWNFETACASSVVGLHMAAHLVESGAYRRILVVVSTSNSVQVLDDDSIGWFVGDGAGALIVERSSSHGDEGILGHHTLNSIGTNDMFVIRSVPDPAGGTRLATVANPEAAAMARDTAEPYLTTCVGAALQRANLGVSDVDFWVFNTPNAWYADFCARVLGVPRGRYHSVYPRYANIGGALMPATLFHALLEGRVRPGQTVAMYAVGSSSTASALVMRVGEVALGATPCRPEISDADAPEAMVARAEVARAEEARAEEPETTDGRPP